MRYTVRAAALATGVPESRLRTWERRYGVPRPARSASGRRLYEEDDLALIRRMDALVRAGLPAAQAADAALEQIASGIAEPPSAPPAAPHPLVATLVDAATRLDESAFAQGLREADREMEAGPAIDTVWFPALAEIGRRWERGEAPLTVEHFASELVRRRLLAEVAAAPAPDESAALLLLACPADERHDLPIAALWLLLRRLRRRVLYLGADVPAPDLVAAVAAAAPDAVALSGTSPTSLPALGEAGRALVASGSRSRLFVGGAALDAGERADQVPGTRLPRSIVEAAAVLVDATEPETAG